MKERRVYQQKPKDRNLGGELKQKREINIWGWMNTKNRENCEKKQVSKKLRMNFYETKWTKREKKLVKKLVFLKEERKKIIGAIEYK